MQNENLERLISEAKKVVADTKILVAKGWERKSRLEEAEEYLQGLERMQPVQPQEKERHQKVLATCCECGQKKLADPDELGYGFVCQRCRRHE